MKNIKETKEKILEEFKGLKEFEVSWGEEVFYSKTIKAKSEEEAEKMFLNGEIMPNNNDITDCDVLDNSLEISESEK